MRGLRGLVIELVVRRKVGVRDRWVVFHAQGVEGKRERTGEMVKEMVEGCFRAWDGDGLGGGWGRVFEVLVEGEEEEEEEEDGEEGMEID